MVLEPNPTWYGAKPAFEQVVIRVIETLRRWKQILLSGEIDYVAGELGFNIEQAMSFERRNPDSYNYLYKARPDLRASGRSTRKPDPRDNRVRQALLLTRSTASR